MAIGIIILVLILIVFYVYYTKIRLNKDNFKGSDIQAVYIISTQFVAKEFLEASFLEIYQKAIESNYQVPQSLLNLHVRELKDCMQNKALAYHIIQDNLGAKTKQEKAHAVALAISLTAQIEDRAAIFSKQLRIPGSAVSQAYKEMLSLLNLTNSDVKEELIVLNNSSKEKIAKQSSQETTNSQSAVKDKEATTDSQASGGEKYSN